MVLANKNLLVATLLAHKWSTAMGASVVKGTNLLISTANYEHRRAALYFLSLSTEIIGLGIAAHTLAATLMYTYLGNQYAIIQGISTATSRATAVAVSEFAGQFGVVECKGAVHELIAQLGPEAAQQCRAATRDGLQLALLIMVSLAVPTGFAFLAACRTLRADYTAGA